VRQFISIVLLAAGILPGQTSASSVDSVQELIEAGKLPEAFRLVSDALSAHPKDAGLLNLRGVIYANQQRFSEARHDFELATSLAPGLTPAWRNLARSCRLSGASEADGTRCALAAWQHVLAVMADDPEA